MKLSWSTLPATIALISVVTPAWADQAPAPSVTVVTARAVRMAPSMGLPGTVVSRNDSHLASEVEGRVASVAEVVSRFQVGSLRSQLVRSPVSRIRD